MGDVHFAWGIPQGMSSERLGCLCCRMCLWKDGRLCLGHLSFVRFGIVSAHAHDDQDVGQKEHGNECDVGPDHDGIPVGRF
jgi:hypothetical protein